jgi:acetylornithine deacetylase/succinyl-diaminopimelate desuccinylase-like protein
MAALVRALVSVDTENRARELREERASMLVVGGAAGSGANFNVVPGSAWFSLDLLQSELSAHTDPGHPVAAALARAVAEVGGTPPRFEVCPGALDTRWYAQLGIRLEVSHGPDEYVDEAAMRRCAAVYARFAGEVTASAM